jgi:hypothetical protein
MPAAGVAGQLTEAHRLAQVRLGVVTVRQMLAVFHILDPDDIDGTFPDWLTAVAPIVQAQRRSSAELAGRYLAVSRALQVGGRETITSTVKADPRAVGYERVTSGSACDFCSMLADRGAVYGEASADFEAHDGCACGAEPVYR